MSDQLYICKRGWKRHSKGDIINHWEWKRLAIESREAHFEPYNPEPVPEEVTSLTGALEERLREKGIQAKFKNKIIDGKTEVDATFTFGDGN